MSKVYVIATAHDAYRRREFQPCIVSLAYEDPSDPYYAQSWAVRGITPPLSTKEKPHA